MCALDVELHHYSIIITWACSFWVFFGRLFKPSEPVETLLVSFQRDQAEPLCKNFVVNDGCVIPYVDVLDGKCGYFGDQYSPKSIGY